MRLNQGNTRYFSSIDSTIKSYLLGFITADGCLQSNGSGSNGLTITIHEKDISILEKLREEIGCENRIYTITGKMTHNHSKQKYHCRFQLFNQLLYADLQSYGLTPKKSITMPDIIENIPICYRKAFIMGYFDGDGSITYNIKSKQFIVSFRGTDAFLNGIVKELSISKYWIYKDKQKNCSSLVFWRKSDVESFFQIYKELSFYLVRKYERFPEYLRIGKDQTISPS